MTTTVEIATVAGNEMKGAILVGPTTENAIGKENTIETGIVTIGTEVVTDDMGATVPVGRTDLVRRQLQHVLHLHLPQHQLH
jgi:hypothetical protein